jgi:prevent-host-death family protein
MYEMYKRYIKDKIPKSTFRTVAAGELRNRGSDIVNAVAYGHENIVLTRHGKPVAAIVSLLVLEALKDIEDEIDREGVRKARADVRKHGTITLAQIKSELKKKP